MKAKRKPPEFPWFFISITTLLRDFQCIKFDHTINKIFTEMPLNVRQQPQSQHILLTLSKLQKPPTYQSNIICNKP